MIFRTGGCLIVGNCSEEVLRFVYVFVKNILVAEFQSIYIHRIDVIDAELNAKKNTKLRKRKITVSTPYFSMLKSIDR
jgi:hypothetical protein